MSTKFSSLQKTLEMTLESITRDGHSWNDFLKSAAFNYKYSFKNQMLIYAQKNDATAVAEMRTWNKYGRYVDKGTSPIFIVDNKNQIRTVFDYSNTNSWYGHEVMAWQYPQNTNLDFTKVVTIAERLAQNSRPLILKEHQDFIIASIQAITAYRCDCGYSETSHFENITLMSDIEIKLAGDYIQQVSLKSISEIKQTTKNSQAPLTSIQKLSETNIKENTEIRSNQDEQSNTTRAFIEDERSRDNFISSQHRRGGDVGNASGRILDNGRASKRESTREHPTTGHVGQRAAEILERGTSPQGLRDAPKRDTTTTFVAGAGRSTGNVHDLGTELHQEKQSDSGNVEQTKRGRESKQARNASKLIERTDLQRHYQHTTNGSGADSGRERPVLEQLTFEQTPLTEKVSGVSALTSEKIDAKLISRCKTLVHLQSTKLWASKGIKLSHVDDYINKFAKGEEYSFARYESGEKADVEVLRTLLTIKNSAESENHKQEAHKLIDELAIINRAMETSLDPHKAITFFMVGAFYEAYGEEAAFLADEFDLKLVQTQNNNIPFVGIPCNSIENYKTALETAGITTTIINEGNIPSVKEKLALNIKPSFTLEINAPDYSYSKTQKLQNNFDAINTLKLIEGENRVATDEERAEMSKYSGWGGLSDSFNERSAKYTQLKAILNDSEYTAARESTLSAFYTQPFIAEQMYQALINFGFECGSVLEPSCAHGNFIGALPPQLQNKVQFSAVEIDSLSGRMAKAIYPNANIQITGFETAALPNDFDVAIGNVPFGQWKVSDAKFNKYNFMIHDYFFAKALDQIRPKGVVAFITSKGTLDKENPSLRKYLASRAELIGAIRLPTTAFKSSGTETTTDIVFLQKRERMSVSEEPWVHLNLNADGIAINQYFIDNPHMVLGDIKMVSSQFGMESACIAKENEDLHQCLKQAVSRLHCTMNKTIPQNVKAATSAETEIVADPNIKNFSFANVDGFAYYRENTKMTLCNKSAVATKRILDYIPLRDAVRKVIDMQLEGYSENEITKQQEKLLSIYNKFVKNNGAINSSAVSQTLNKDASFNLVSTLERLDENKNVVQLADIFYKRTIQTHSPVTHVDTSSEALAVSLGEKARIDIEYMKSLTGFTEQQIYNDLNGVIFLNPLYDANTDLIKYVPADEYLSGNIREKLIIANTAAKQNKEYDINVKCLQKVMPQDLKASEIFVKLGSTWIPDTDITSFIKEVIKPYSTSIQAKYSATTSEWSITNKQSDKENVIANKRYGTSRANAYNIIENTLNLRDVRIYDVKEVDGKDVRILNTTETEAAQYKQTEIKEAFTEWLWKDMSRRDRLCKAYNEKFNSFRTREFDGAHLVFSGINTNIQLKQHQKNAVARILHGGNTLLAHVVGAGKTYEMIAAAQESKRLGLCSKSMIVVPNHLTEQFASDYLELYPNANILTSRKKDFEPNNRKKFCGRIATGDYDAVIIGHTQFEKIPLSAEQQEKVVQEQINEIKYGIMELRRNNGENFTIKQMERLQKQLEFNLKKLLAQERKDNLVTFEQLGVDKLFVDEAHNFKNLFLYTKMRNVAGISQTAAQKSTDLYMKCKYLDELTGGKGIVFATGTPISNSMAEMYTLQKYLQNSEITKQGLANFDAWASTFGETETVIELSPEGKGIRPKTRFSKFNNLPELITMFKQFADVQTADMLDLDVPKLIRRERVVGRASVAQKLVLNDLAKLADLVRNRKIEPHEANMLTITNSGRKLALDIRLMGDEYEKDDNSKVDNCAEKVFNIWRETAERKATQLIFCDLSTPNKKGVFNIYDEVKNELILRGIPENEIAFIHDANTEMQKAELFAKVRSGSVRVLLGSTAKLGAGTNIQKKLVALHHLDCPWRPSDLEQREGRIIRQGNDNDEISISTYITENTFDAYLYQIIENKQRFISQIMTSKTPARSASDIDETVLSYAEIKALATGSPHIKEKMELDISVAKLNMQRSNYLKQKYDLEDDIVKKYPAEIEALKEVIIRLEKDVSSVAEFESHDTNEKSEDTFSPMIIQDVSYQDKVEAGKQLLEFIFDNKPKDNEHIKIGSYKTFNTELEFDRFHNEYKLYLVGNLKYKVVLSTSEQGNILRIDNAIKGLPNLLAEKKQLLEQTKEQLVNAEVEVKRPFAKQTELTEKTERIKTLEALLAQEAAATDEQYSNAADIPQIVECEDDFDLEM